MPIRRFVRTRFEPRKPTGKIEIRLPARAKKERFNGDRSDVILQGFFWGAWQFNWYKTLAQCGKRIVKAGFTRVWFPPCAIGASDDGYLPTEWNNLNSKYGTQAELEEAIAAIQPAGAIADVVVNHRCGTRTAGADFTNPPFSDNAKAVVGDDESGAGLGTRDTGDSIAAGRDLDHSNPSVQEEIVKWMKNVLKPAGFTGWRYDMVRGYDGKYVSQYNQASKPQISIGEYWDNEPQNVLNWITATGGNSMAFDFPIREALREAMSFGRWNLLDLRDAQHGGLISHWPAMAVTFIENHDTEAIRGNGLAFPSHRIVQGYAYILTHPGIPCVFWRHFFDLGELVRASILALIDLRNETGINRDSVVQIHRADAGVYAATIDGKVAMKLGPGNWAPDEDEWELAISGDEFAVWRRIA